MCEWTVDPRGRLMNGGAVDILPMHRRSTGVHGQATAWAGCPRGCIFL